MPNRVWARHAAGAALVMVGCASAIRAQSAPADPWSKVPALPTGCYADDAEVARFVDAHTALAADYERQQKVNEALQKQFNEMDITTKMQRMQAFMMKDPQKATAFMQAMQATAATVTSQAQTSSAEGPKFDQELEAIHAKYRSEVNTLLKPIDDRAEAFFNAHAERGEAGPYLAKKADEAQYNAIMQERNAAYEKICAKWWGPSGAVHAWFGRYKTHLVNEAKSYEASDAAVVAQMQIMETPSGGYRSLSPIEAARTYTEKARSIMAERPGKDVSTGWLRP